MEVKEMHIEVNQTLQKQGASITRKFFPDELDWVLNKAQDKFRDSKIRRKADDSGRYEIDQMNADALRVWTVTDKLLPAYCVPGSNIVYGILPNDYTYLLSDRSNRLNACNNSAYKETSSASYQLLAINFPKSPISSGPFYKNLIVTINGISEYAAPAGGIVNKDDRFVMTNLITRNSRLYWERLGEYYKANTFFILLPGTSNSASLAFDGNTYAATVAASLTLSTYTIGNLDLFPANNRLTNHTQLPDLLSTYFYRASVDSPISALSSGIIKVYSDGNFTVNGILIDYIRKARKISLSLDQHCELPEEFHQDICDLAVELIMVDIGDQRQQGKTQQDLTRG